MISTILSNIPWYVYLIVYLLIRRSISALSDQIVPVQKIFMLPLVMTVWAIYDINDTFGITGITLAGIFSGLVIGIMYGIYLAKGKVIYYDRNNLLYKGSPLTLIMVIAIFIFKVMVFSILGFNPVLINSHVFALIFALSFAILAGMTLGRLISSLNLLRLKPAQY